MESLLQGTIQIITVILIVMAIALVLAMIGLAVLARGIRELDVPEGADFFTTLRHVPLLLVVVIDLLDFALDIFSAPIVWIALNSMGLSGLRDKAAIEGLIPFTQVIPTFTVCWFAARWFNLGSPPGTWYAHRDQSSHRLDDRVVYEHAPYDERWYDDDAAYDEWEDQRRSRAKRLPARRPERE